MADGNLPGGTEDVKSNSLTEQMDAKVKTEQAATADGAKADLVSTRLNTDNGQIRLSSAPLDSVKP